jgi:hypothetical protein
MTFHPQSEFKHFTQIEVEACQWDGVNLDEMKRLLAPYVGSNQWDGPEVYSSEIEDYFQPGKTYNMLQFYAWGDDQEVDPGQWVVIYSDGDGAGDGEVMTDGDFKKMGYRQ